MTNPNMANDTTKTIVAPGPKETPVNDKKPQSDDTKPAATDAKPSEAPNSK